MIIVFAATAGGTLTTLAINGGTPFTIGYGYSNVGNNNCASFYIIPPFASYVLTDINSSGSTTVEFS